MQSNKIHKVFQRMSLFSTYDSSLIETLCVSCWTAYILQDDTRSVQYQVSKLGLSVKERTKIIKIIDDCLVPVLSNFAEGALGSRWMVWLLWTWWRTDLQGGFHRGTGFRLSSV